jgi:hypothetical protein
VCNARHTSSRSVQGRAGGAGNSRFLGIGERASSIGTRRCAELLAILRVCIVRNLSAQYLPRMQQRYAPDGDQRKSPEIATGRRTSPSADACLTPHCGKTQRRPARHVPASATSTRVRVAGREPAQRTSPTRCARHRLPARMPLPRLPPRTHAAPAHPARRNGPNAPAPRMHPEGPRKQGFPHMSGGCAGLWQ